MAVVAGRQGNESFLHVMTVFSVGAADFTLFASFNHPLRTEEVSDTEIHK
jgi:hypothetical protein